MSQTLETKAAAPRQGKAATLETDYRKGHTLSHASRQDGTPYFTRQAIAEDAARQLLYSWCEHGRHAGNDFPPDRFPSESLAAIAESVAWAASQGVRGMSDIMAECFLDAPEHIRSGFVECCEGYLPPSPEHCRPLVEKLAAFHLEKRTREIFDAAHHAIERGGQIDRRAMLDEIAALEAESGSAGNAFPITRAGETAGMAMVSDFVESLLTDGGASVIYGPSNCGKSFWILDLAVCVATGTDFRDELQVDRGAVVYVALEGSFGVRNRVEALKRAGRLPEDAPLFLCFSPVSLLEAGHAARLASSVKQAAEESGFPCRLVVLDTLARAMAGGDENAGQDMTAAVASIDAIRAATGAHVAVVHHCGKDEARGARGHSSLRAAVDTEIEVSRPEGETISTVRVTKQRDMQAGDPMPFSLKVVELGTDRRGKPITSCVVHHEDSMMAASTGKKGRGKSYHADQLLEHLPAASVAQWQKTVNEETGIGRTLFYDFKRELETRKAIRKTASGIQKA